MFQPMLHEKKLRITKLTEKGAQNLNFLAMNMARNLVLALISLLQVINADELR